MHCTLQPDPGLCNKKMDRWYYNVEMKMCTIFTYSGCRGNPNNFESRQACINYCGSLF